MAAKSKQRTRRLHVAITDESMGAIRRISQETSSSMGRVVELGIKRLENPEWGKIDRVVTEGEIARLYKAKLIKLPAALMLFYRIKAYSDYPLTSTKEIEALFDISKTTLFKAINRLRLLGVIDDHEIYQIDKLL